MTTDYSSQLVRTQTPLNAEPPLDLLRRRHVTPPELFYIRTHGSIPTVDPSEYRLSIEGAVGKQLRLSIADIRNNFARTSVMATLQCAGNRRSEFNAIRPVPDEVPWGAQTIGNAIWSGALLEHVLKAAAIQPHVRHVAFIGLDIIEKAGDRFEFGASIPIRKAMSPETILAYEMNGKPLDAIHGFPLRAIVPGFIGARSVKWLDTITAQDEPSANYYQARSYKMFPADVDSRTARWEEGVALEETVINSVICEPQDGDDVGEGLVRFLGYAIGGGGAPVDRVELSSDLGKTWTAAELSERGKPWSWCFWEARLHLSPGAHRIVARAWDSNGSGQPEDGDKNWNFKGYAYNAWHAVNVRVR